MVKIGHSSWMVEPKKEHELHTELMGNPGVSPSTNGGRDSS